MTKKEFQKITCVIPVRYSSIRFSGKAFALINGKSMISRVYDNALRASFVDDVIIAAYDQEIEDYCKKNNMKYVRVSEECKNGSEAVADVARGLDSDYIFEMQGDQPLVIPDIIDSFIDSALKIEKKDRTIDVVIPYAECQDECTKSEDILKVVVTVSERLVFQTRQPIKTGFRTLGLYLWNRKSIIKFSELPVSEIEESEKSHPIRLYMNDFYVQGIRVSGSEWVEVDREEHITQVEKILNKREG